MSIRSGTDNAAAATAAAREGAPSIAAGVQVVVHCVKALAAALAGTTAHPERGLWPLTSAASAAGLAQAVWTALAGLFLGCVMGRLRY